MGSLITKAAVMLPPAHEQLLCSPQDLAEGSGVAQSAVVAAGWAHNGKEKAAQCCGVSRAEVLQGEAGCVSSGQQPGAFLTSARMNVNSRALGAGS